MKKSLIYIVIALLLIVGGAIGFLFLFPSSNKNPFLGIYRNNDITINVYQYEESRIYFTGTNDLYGMADITETADKEKVAIGQVDTFVYELSLEDGNLRLKSNNDKIPSGLYT